MHLHLRPFPQAAFMARLMEDAEPGWPRSEPWARTEGGAQEAGGGQGGTLTVTLSLGPAQGPNN